MPVKKDLWTFIVDFEGGTYISQYSDMSILEAIGAYNATDPSGQGAVPIDDEPVAITGTQGVFCSGGLTEKDESILVNIVATENYD